MRRVNVKQIVENGLCLGCGLCVDSPEDMSIDSKGFLRPGKTTNDHERVQSCPGARVEHHNAEGEYDLLWGPIIEGFVGFAINDHIRKSASSGGGITAILSYLLSEKLVEGVIQVGVSSISPIRNETKIVQNVEDLIKNSGSRYAPSSTLDVLSDVLEDSNTYAVVGKPCDIAALRDLIERKVVDRSKFKYLISFMCAGVPSERGSLEVLKHMGVKLSDVSHFKYRGDGWPGLTKAVVGEKVYSMTYNESWGGVLNRYLQPRCKICADGIGEAADIVCADAWYGDSEGYPTFDERDGRSLILARTHLGKKVVEHSVSNGYLSVQSVNPRVIDNIQPYQKNRKQTALARMLALQLLFAKRPKFFGFHLFRNAVNAGFITQLKAFIGTFLRKLKGRI